MIERRLLSRILRQNIWEADRRYAAVDIERANSVRIEGRQTIRIRRAGGDTHDVKAPEFQVIPKFSQQPAPVGYAVHIEVVGVSITRAGKSDYPHGQSAKRLLHSL